MGYIFTLIISFSLIFNTFSQTSVIHCINKTYAGETLSLMRFKDFITLEEEILCTTKVDTTGEIKFEINLNEVTQTFIYLGSMKGIIYLEPGKSYQIKLPNKIEKDKKDLLNPFFTESEFYIGIVNTSKSELNRLIVEFEDVFTNYLTAYYDILLKRSPKAELDTAIAKMDKRFEGRTHPYFDIYRKYRYAYLRHLCHERDIEFMARKYFNNQPIYPQNNAYTELFNQVFSQYFAHFQNLKSGKKLMDALASDKPFVNIKMEIDTTIKGDTLKELVCLRSLMDLFYQSTIPRELTISILDNISNQSVYPNHQQIAREIKTKSMRLIPGSEAPNFVCTDKVGTKIDLKKYRGKFVYLCFTMSDSYESKQHFIILKDIYTRMRKQLEIVTISADPKFNDMLYFAKENKYNWVFLDGSNQTEIFKTYNVKAYPSYFLIDPEGNLVLSPSISPAENFEKAFVGYEQYYRIERARKQYKKNLKDK